MGWKAAVISCLALSCCLTVYSQDWEQCLANDTLPVNGSATNEDRVDLPLDVVDLNNYIELCADGLDLEINDTIRNLTRRSSEICSEFTIDTGDVLCSDINPACNCEARGNFYTPNVADDCNSFYQRSNLSNAPTLFDCPAAGLKFDVTKCVCNYADRVSCPVQVCAEDSQQNTGMKMYWGWDEGSRQCVQFQYSGCGGNDNRFETRLECEGICADPCTVPPDEGEATEVITNSDNTTSSGNCDFYSGLYYAYNADTDSCVEINYKGCEGNRNRFESNEECLDICKIEQPPIPATTQLPSIAGIAEGELTVGGKRLRRQTTDELDDQSVDQFCDQFKKNYPDAASIVKTLANLTSPDIESTLIEELENLIDIDGENPPSNSPVGISEVVRRREKRFLFGFFTRPLKHTSVRIINKSNCRRIEITIRIKCIRAIWRRPSRSQATKMCNLIKAGIKKHWEVDILKSSGAVDYPVTINVKETFFFAKPVFLKWYGSVPSNSNWLRSFNPGRWWIPMWMKYRGFAAGAAEDLAFMETAAHEFGHDCLFAEKGLVWSWGHEGTSTIFGNINSNTQPIPNNPNPINLMHYHVGGDTTNYYDRIRASQSQIRALVNYATFRWKPFWCPGEIGAPCITGGNCNSGICSWFRCVNCNGDGQCGSGKYCKGRFNPFIVNTCSNKKSNGALCLRDAICASDKCDGGQCVECENDGDCPSNEYCSNKDIPLVLNRCKAKKSNGGWCLRDGVCQSGKCDGARCVECENNGDCPSGQYCKWNNVPLVLNDCVNKLGSGGWCITNSQCANNRCDGLRCVECETNSHCPSGQYCKNRNIPLVLNKCTNKKCTGWCSSGSQCKSGNCRWYARCKKC